jgi:hypothetical protein
MPSLPDYPTVALEGGQVAVLHPHAASASHATKTPYSCLRAMYVLQSSMCSRAPRKRTNFSELRKSEVQLRRIPLLRTRVNKGPD